MIHPQSAPTVSVIIPAYNQARYVSRSIESVLKQTFSEFELIVVDDGSTDETPQIIASIQDPRLRVIRQVNAGLSAARNAGLRSSSAPLVTFLDADDYFLLDKLEVLIKFLKDHPDIGLVAGHPIYINDADDVASRPPMSQTRLSLPELLFENPICVSGILLRREWLDRVGVFDEALRACEDWDLWLRLLVAGCQMTWVDHYVVAYRVHPGQMTSQAGRMRKAMFMVLDKFFSQSVAENWMEKKSAVYALALVHAAAYAYLANELDQAKRDLAEAMRLDSTLRDNRYKKLVRVLVAWAYDPRAIEPQLFLQRIVTNLPPNHRGLGIQLRRAMADALLAPFFRNSRENWYAQRGDLFKAILYKPDWLLNRGVLRIMASAWLGI